MPQGNPSLTKSHFMFIADVINEHEWGDNDEKIAFADRMADELARHNDRFDRERFLDACGISDEDDDDEEIDG